MTTPPTTIGDVATLVRSKNAGPFWQTLDIFLADDTGYHAVADAPGLDAEAIGRAYRVDIDREPVPPINIAIRSCRILPGEPHLDTVRPACKECRGNRV